MITDPSSRCTVKELLNGSLSDLIFRNADTDCIRPDTFFVVGARGDGGNRAVDVIDKASSMRIS